MAIVTPNRWSIERRKLPQLENIWNGTNRWNRPPLAAASSVRSVIYRESRPVLRRLPPPPFPMRTIDGTGQIRRPPTPPSRRRRNRSTTRPIGDITTLVPQRTHPAKRHPMAQQRDVLLRTATFRRGRCHPGPSSTTPTPYRGTSANCTRYRSSPPDPSARSTTRYTNWNGGPTPSSAWRSTRGDITRTRWRW